MSSTNDLGYQKVFFKDTSDDDPFESLWVLKQSSDLNNCDYYLQHIISLKFVSIDNDGKFQFTDGPNPDQVVKIVKLEKDDSAENDYYSLTFKNLKNDCFSYFLYQQAEEKNMEDVDVFDAEKVSLEAFTTFSYFDIQLCLSVKNFLEDCRYSHCNELKLLPALVIALTKVSKFIVNEKLSHIQLNAPVVPTQTQIPMRQKVRLYKHLYLVVNGSQINTYTLPIIVIFYFQANI